MISLNKIDSTIINHSNTKVSAQDKQIFVQDKAKDLDKVELQGKVQEQSVDNKIKVDSSNAHLIANDIASLLSGGKSAIQANINSFDAARLLS